MTFLKTKYTLPLLTAVIGLGALGMAPTFAEDAAFTDAQKEELNRLMENYIRENPKVIVSALQAHQLQQKKAQEEEAKEKIKEHMTYFERKDAPDYGSEKPEVTVVEFFDYNCGYCKKAIPDIQKAAEENDNVRFVFQEMPILGPTSKTAANWAIAAHKQGKYFEYHVALMEHRGAKTEDSLAKLAKDVGLDVDQMKADAADAQTALDIKKSMDVAKDVGINGTPAFVINGKLYPGYLGPEGLQKAIDEAQSADDKG